MLDPSNPTIPGNVAGMTDPQNGYRPNDFSSSLKCFEFWEDFQRE